MLTGRKYLLDLTAEQAGFAERIGGVCRAVWNTALEQRRAYRRRGAFISYAEQARQLAQAKRELAEEFEEEFEWLAEVRRGPLVPLQQDLLGLREAKAKPHAVRAHLPMRGLRPESGPRRQRRNQPA